MKRGTVWQGTLGCCAGLWIATAGTAWAAPDTGPGVVWRCEVVYQPAREVWVRAVRFDHDGARLRQLAIDGVVVYAFGLQGGRVVTAIDNERIQIDLTQRLWRSDFRGKAQGQGRCEPD